MLGGFTGLLPIGWIVLNIIFLHRLADETGACKIQEDSIANITSDRRLQLLLIAFSYGAFFEGAAGFGTPVAVTAAILIGLGFSPLAASGLSLIANTAPVAYGALGTPIITMAKVHGYDLMALSGMVGRQLPFFSLLVPFWLIWAFAGRKGMWEIWPAILVSGLSFAIPQYLVSNFIGPRARRRDRGHLLDGLPDPVPARVEAEDDLDLDLAEAPQGRTGLRRTGDRPGQCARRRGDPALAAGRRSSDEHADASAAAATRGMASTGSGGAGPIKTFTRHPTAVVVRAWLPWIVLTVFVFAWGLPVVKTALNGIFAPTFPSADCTR
jgi:lactate permease